PAVVAVHAGGHEPPVDHLRLGVDDGGLLAPGVEVAVVAGQQVGVHEADERPVDAVAVVQPAGLRDADGEAPAVGAAVPLAAAGAPDLAVEADVARDDAAVGLHAAEPGV